MKEPMKASNKGITLIKEFEGLRLMAYQDVKGVWTIGYGHTKTAREGMVITKMEAEALLREDLSEFEKSVYTHVYADLNQNQFDALVSLVYNIGPAAFKASTLRKLINAKADQEVITTQWRRWNKSGGKVYPGLKNRRASEIRLYFTKV